MEKCKSILKVSIPILLILFLILLIVFSPDTFRWITVSFKPVIYALILAYLLDSAVKFFVNKLKIRRVQGIFLACLLLLGLIVFLIYIIVPKIVENINAIASFFISGNIDIIQIVTDISDKIDNGYVQYVADSILHASESMQDIINSILIKLSNTLMQLVTNIGSSTLTIVTSFIINIYMLIEKEDILARGKRLIFAYFDDTKANKILHVFSEANLIFKSFLNGKILDSFIVGIICAIAFSIFKVPYAPLLGTVIGAFNMIPYFGPIIGSVPVIVVAFFVDPTKALTALIIIIVIQQIDANFLDPKIVGKNVGVSPFWIITAVTVGGNLFGVPGMLFSVPLTVLFKTVVEESINMRLVEKGISEYEKDKLKTPKTKK
ncbi:AI-2E family transporter [Sedimentibacter sp. MB31-C6]|uniref:AI-2E family transporter n=1 Tax=Sedimentibacter sp. MB31-C6 TaxID=3109366 RepID=UPI002DDD7F37|nr:AI-2E family transporter [Sedimentibacter sp. MB36-C1]WSI03501.1 AI-2E family transporter [Sedimentibacter sp. MB36-C1]